MDKVNDLSQTTSTSSSSQNISQNNTKISSKKQYRLNDSEILSALKSNCEDMNKRLYHEYLCNLLLMSSELEIANKMQCICFLSLYDYESKSTNKSKTIYYSRKSTKYFETIKGIEPYVYLRTLSREIVILQKQKNYFKSLYYIFKSQKIANDSKISYQNKKFLDTKENEVKAQINSQLQIKENKFKNSNKNQFQEILKVLNNIVSFNENLLNNYNYIYFYIINKKWFDKAINFVDNLIKNKELISFQLYDIYYSYNEIEKKTKSNSIPYPGPIENYSITVFKDIWIDPLNEDENYLIKKNMKLKEDFYFVDANNWKFLEQIFDATNKIKRKIETYNDLIDFKILILDKKLKKQYNLFKLKNIQLNKNNNIKQFKEKIIRCVDNILKDENKDETNKDENPKNTNKNIIDDIVFYFLPKKKKNLLIEICAAFKNNIPQYKTIDFKPITIKGELTLSEFFEKTFDKTENYLIIEIIHNNEKENSFIQHIISNQSGKYFCEICHKEILHNEKYDCGLCQFSIYCSEHCAFEDEIHLTFHKLLLENFYIEKFNLQNFLKINILNQIKDKYAGTKGLTNFGNTCYINSVLQCLSNTIDLTKYFFLNIHKTNINMGNKIGSNGKISESYANFIEYMWSDEKNEPMRHFIKTFFECQKIITNCGEQQDAQEFLSILLDLLHEDLNCICNKPYIELEEQKKDETDYEASKRWWDSYKKRENSIIVDLFHGQYKSIIICEKCGKKSITYDPFMILGLPIPQDYIKIFIKYFFNGNFELIEFHLEEKSTIFQLKVKIAEFSRKLGHRNFEICELDKNHVIKKIWEGNNLDNKTLIVNLLKENNEIYEICAFNKVNSLNIYVYPTNSNYSDENLDIKYPIAISINQIKNFHDLKSEILNIFKQINNNFSEINDPKELNIGIIHEFKKKPGMLDVITKFFSGNNCIFCNNKYKKYCLIPKKYEEKPIFEILEMFFNKEIELPILFTVSCKKINLLKYIYTNDDKLNTNDIHNILNENNGPRKELELKDCFNSFCEEETLNKDNMWYCNICKTHQVAKNKLRIYKTPLYLIIQLKRFKKYDGMFSQSEEKNDTFINYPKENLDISPYIENTNENEKKNAKYNLYAIVQHHGNINRGHYTAICYNNTYNWLFFNDSQVKMTSTPISKNAYLLFYKKINMENNE